MTVVVNVVDDDAMIMEWEERIVVTRKLTVMIEKYDFVLCFGVFRHNNKSYISWYLTAMTIVGST